MLGLGPAQLDLVAAQRRPCATAPTARADAIYTGVLYDALDFATLSPAARRRATSRLAVTSSPLRAGPPGRPDPRLPALRRRHPARRRLGRRRLARGPRRGDHRRHAAAGCSSTCARARTPPSGGPTPDVARRVATVRVLHESGGRRTVVSHFNKATKGRIVRALLEDGADPRTPRALADDPDAPRLDRRARRADPEGHPARRGGQRGLTGSAQRDHVGRLERVHPAQCQQVGDDRAHLRQDHLGRQVVAVLHRRRGPAQRDQVVDHRRGHPVGDQLVGDAARPARPGRASGRRTTPAPARADSRPPPPGARRRGCCAGPRRAAPRGRRAAAGARRAVAGRATSSPPTTPPRRRPAARR